MTKGNRSMDEQKVERTIKRQNDRAEDNKRRQQKFQRFKIRGVLDGILILRTMEDG